MRSTILSLVTCACAIAAFAQTGAAPARSWKPYTATEVTTLYLDDGRELAHETAVIAVKADGSKAKSVHKSITPPTGASVQTTSVRTVLNVSMMREFTIQPTTRSITTMRIDSQDLTKAPTSCDALYPTLKSRQFDPTPEISELLGFKVVTVAGDVMLPDRTVHIMKWMAPDLDCIRLRERSTITLTGGGLGGAERN